ncbi:MAG: hypothetical protein KKG04_08730 [Candidatus Thermoplasmatota archaeon]|nr:hypothetical protein [Candidatus Thermoplasmatota archaeon]
MSFFQSCGFDIIALNTIDGKLNDMNIEELKGLLQDLLRENPELNMQYDYDDKRNWFGIQISDDAHHAYTYTTDTGEIDMDKIRKELALWKKTFAY